MKKENYIKITLNIFYFPLFYFFSYIIPKNKKLILLGSSHGLHFSGNTKYLYLYLIKNEKNNFYWVTSNKEIYHELKLKKYPVLYFFSLKAFLYILRARYLVVENGAKDIVNVTLLNGRFNIIQTWHGTPLKKIAFDSFNVKNKSLYNKIFLYFYKKEVELYKIILACSVSSAKNLQSALLNNKNVKVLGYSRNDIFINKSLSYINYKQKLNLYKYDKIILYAPTFRDNKNILIPFSDKFLIQLNNFLKENNYILLIRAHPLAGNEFKISNLDYIKNITKSVDDVQEILIYTDILIADYSSLIFDYSLSDRPIIFYSYDYDEYISNSREIYYDYFQEFPGPFAKNEKELLILIKNVEQWFNDVQYKEKYKVFRNKFHQFQDGKSCERLYKFITEEKF